MGTPSRITTLQVCRERWRRRSGGTASSFTAATISTACASATAGPNSSTTHSTEVYESSIEENNMNKLALLFVFATCAALSQDQPDRVSVPFSDPSRPKMLKASVLNGSITV